MKTNPANMMKQIKQMQDKMKKAQDELKDKEVEACSGGDMVTAVVNGHQELKKLTLNPEVVDSSDIEMLEDLIIAAVNEAIKKSSALASSEMGKLTGGLNIPGLNGLL